MIAADTIASVHESSARSDAAYAIAVDTSSIVSEAGESSRKWRPMPGELVSLWDMLRFHASSFLRLVNLMQDSELTFTRAEKDFAQQFNSSGYSLEQYQDIVLQTSGKVDQKIEKIHKAYGESIAQFRNTLKNVFDIAEGFCSDIELSSAIDYINYVRSCIDKATQFREFQEFYQTLRGLIVNQLEQKAFFFAPDAAAKYFLDESPFGAKIKDKYPKLTEDISEASRCMGLGRFTATVFHLMRVMEKIVQRFAKRLGLTVNLEQPWGAILAPIDREIEAMPGGTSASAQQKAWKGACSEVAVFLRHVKNAWRNDTMHPKRTYTEEEATRVFETVKAFVQSFAKLRRKK